MPSFHRLSFEEMVDSSRDGPHQEAKLNNKVASYDYYAQPVA